MGDTVTKITARLAAEVLSSHEVRHIVVSPGSRCAPLVEAFTRDDYFRVKVIIDERSAAFYALGLAQRGESVALVCTSGTAMLNYAPALAEAFYQGVPIIALTADRAMQWIDQDDSQTIRQFEGLSHFVKASFDIPEVKHDDREMYRYALRTLNQAIAISRESKRGPVHVNMQFNAPLTSGTPAILNGGGIGKSYIESLPGTRVLDNREYHHLHEMLTGKRVLVVVGFMAPDHKLSANVKKFSSLGNVALLAEKLSNLRSGWPTGIDRVLRCVDPVADAPDIVITMGGALVSRHVKDWLRTMPEVEHWSIGEGDTFADCFSRMTMRIKVSPEILMGVLAHLGRKYGCGAPTGYHELWRRLWREADMRSKQETPTFGDFAALKWIYSHGIPHTYNIQLSNGTSVRYAELLASEKQHALYCNRGTSGIEGCTSTAVGSADSYQGHTLLVTGDMSFRHDLGALMLKAPDRFKILVVNNGGGDIFRYVKTTSGLDGREENYCCRDHMQPAIEMLARSFGYEYFTAGSMAELKREWIEFIARGTKSIFELRTAGCDNAAQLRDYFKRNK